MWNTCPFLGVFFFFTIGYWLLEQNSDYKPCLTHRYPVCSWGLHSPRQTFYSMWVGWEPCSVLLPECLYQYTQSAPQAPWALKEKMGLRFIAGRDKYYVTSKYLLLCQSKVSVVAIYTFFASAAVIAIFASFLTNVEPNIDHCFLISWLRVFSLSPAMPHLRECSSLFTAWSHTYLYSARKETPV